MSAFDRKTQTSRGVRGSVRWRPPPWREHRGPPAPCSQARVYGPSASRISSSTGWVLTTRVP